MTGGTIQQRLGQLLHGCLTEVITDLGAAVTTDVRVEALDGAGHEANGGRIAVVIGFGNDHIHGALTLMGDRRLFVRLLPHTPTIPTEAQDVVDWARELANLTVGRFKNRAHARGVDVALDCPRTLSVAQADSATTDQTLTPWDLEIEGMQLETRLTFEILGSVTLSGPDEYPTHEPACEGGDVLIF